MTVKDKTRSLGVGTTGLVWARIVDDYGQDLSGLTVEVCEVSPAGVESAWAAPADTETDLPGVFRAALQHVATNGAGLGWWGLKVRVTNGALVEVMTAGRFLVVL